jgi:hypothetical protein
VCDHILFQRNHADGLAAVGHGIVKLLLPIRLVAKHESGRVLETDADRDGKKLLCFFVQFLDQINS